MNFNPTSLNDTAQVKDGLERFGNVYVTKPGSRHTVEKPGSKGSTIFRIYPFVDKSNPSAPAIMPLRNTNTPQKGYGDNELFASIIRLPVMDYAGVNGKFTAITSVFGQDLNFKGPLETFVKTMNSNLKATPQKFPVEWRAWYKERSKDGDDKMGDSSPIPFPDVRGFVQGELYANNGKTFKSKGTNTPDPRKPVLLMLKHSATLALLAKANEHRKTLVNGAIVDIKEGDFDQVFQFNRMVDPTYGYAMVFDYHKGGNGLLSHYEVNPEQDPHRRDAATGAVVGGCNVVAIDPVEVVNNFTPWGELIHFMTEKEQVQLLLQHYPPAAVDFALRSSQFYDLVPAEAKGKWDEVAKQVLSGAPWQPQLAAPGAAPGMGAPMPGIPGAPAPVQTQEEQPPASWGWPAAAPGHRYVKQPNGQWTQEPVAAAPTPPPPPPVPQAPLPPPPPPAAPPAPAAPAANWASQPPPPGAFLPPPPQGPALPPQPTMTLPPAPPAPAAPGAPPLPPGAGPVTPATNASMDELRKRMNMATSAATPAVPPPPAQ